ncbi:MAG: adenylate/guanylate cyclase domain-containing protein [Planctomycetota bacterium]|jgi:adenylate cyclase
MSDTPHRISTCPDDVTVDVAPEQTLLDAMLAAGVPVTHACGGKARCSTCRVRVECGDGTLCPRGEAEAAMAERLMFDRETRLACQTRVRGDAAVRRLVIDDCDQELATRALAGERAAPVGHEERVTILFSDVAGFTPLSEKLPPYDVIHLLNRWFIQAGRAIEAADGRIDNYMGDGLLAIFRGTAGAANAVRAGLAMQDVADEVSAYAQPLYGREFGVRVGIHCGTVVIGDLGAAHNRRETVIGDAVNVASRIEAANKEAGTRVLVSEPVIEHLRDRVETGRTADIALKGKTGTFRLFEVTAIA